MNLNAFGTDTFLRHQIERRLKYLQSDDQVGRLGLITFMNDTLTLVIQMIVNEGVESLTIPELTQVCQSRGIRSIGVSPARMRSELQQWIDLHLKYQVPSSLLLLSRAFTLSERLPASDEEALQGSAEALQATLSSLPHQMVNEAQLKVSEAEGVATYKQKLDVLKEQEEMIQDELEQEESAETRQKEIKEQDAAVKKVKEQLQSQSPETELKEPVDGDVPITASVPGSSEPVLVEEQPVVVDATVKTSESKDLAHEEEDGKLSEEELKKLGEALKSMTHESALEDVKVCAFALNCEFKSHTLFNKNRDNSQT